MGSATFFGFCFLYVQFRSSVLFVNVLSRVGAAVSLRFGRAVRYCLRSLFVCSVRRSATSVQLRCGVLTRSGDGSGSFCFSSSAFGFVGVLIKFVLPSNRRYCVPFSLSSRFSVVVVVFQRHVVFVRRCGWCRSRRKKKTGKIPEKHRNKREMGDERLVRD